jgi:hypothetical protein
MSLIVGQGLCTVHTLYWRTVPVVLVTATELGQMIPHPAQEAPIPQHSEKSSARIDTVVSMARLRLERDIRQLFGEIAEMDRHIAETECGTAEVEASAVALTVPRQA